VSAAAFPTIRENWQSAADEHPKCAGGVIDLSNFAGTYLRFESRIAKVRRANGRLESNLCRLASAISMKTMQGGRGRVQSKDMIAVKKSNDYRAIASDTRRAVEKTMRIDDNAYAIYIFP